VEWPAFCAGHFHFIGFFACSAIAQIDRSAHGRAEIYAASHLS